MMCRESSWLLGAEGYAIVTLQQAVLAICPASRVQVDAEPNAVLDRDYSIVSEDENNNMSNAKCETE